MSEMITLVALMAIYAQCAGIKYMIMFGFKFVSYMYRKYF